MTALLKRERQLSLSARLFLSYLLLLAVTLGVITAAFLVLVSARPAAQQPVYDEIAAQAAALPLRDLWNASVGRRLLPAEQQFTTLVTGLAVLADESGLRILLVSEQRRVVIWDSAAELQRGDALRADFQPMTLPDALRFSRPGLGNGNGGGPERGVSGLLLAGDGREWLFIGVDAFSNRLLAERVAVLFAAPRPPQNLRAALAAFGTDFFPVIGQALIVGVGAAVVLAIVISRGIAQPLRRVADNAAAIARSAIAGADGDAAPDRLPLTGPAEVRAVAEAVNRMSAEVRAEQQSQQDFLANVSHDLKTPLTSIQGFSQAIIDGAAPDPVAAARIIHQEAARMTRMVTELTDLARIQAGRLSMTMQPLDLGALTSAIGERLAIVAQQKQIALQVEAVPLPPVAGDGDRLVQVLTNLISNAIQYTPSGGAITVRTAVRANGVEVSVSDTGIGIAAADLARIFERFYQVDKARGPRRGTGLGLAIVHEIVTAHGGTITAASAGPGRGSTFTVWLPFADTRSRSRSKP